jgi:hypothetical protein
MKHPIAQTRNGVAVYVDLVKSQAARAIAQQPYLLGHDKEALQNTTAKGPQLHVEQNMGRPIGYSFVVETKSSDTILYAQLVHDTVFTRFVKNGKPLASQHLTMILSRDDDGTYELHDTWIGHINPPRPGSDNETTESREYWDTHAFVLDGQPVQLRTVTKVCPY